MAKHVGDPRTARTTMGAKDARVTGSTPSLTIVVVLALACAWPGTVGADCLYGDILPEPDASPDGTDECTYENLPFDLFRYDNNVLNVEWGSDYEVRALYVLADWEVIASYAPGTDIVLPIDYQKQRYDFAGRFERISTGEVFLGVTPIWCVSASIPAPVDGCFGPSPTGCSVTSSPESCSSVQVSCDGDNGTCKDCGSSTLACCEATVKTETVKPDGTVRTETKHVKQSKKCPEEGQ